MTWADDMPAFDVKHVILSQMSMPLNFPWRSRREEKSKVVDKKGETTFMSNPLSVPEVLKHAFVDITCDW